MTSATRHRPRLHARPAALVIAAALAAPLLLWEPAEAHAVETSDPGRASVTLDAQMSPTSSALEDAAGPEPSLPQVSAGGVGGLDVPTRLDACATPLLADGCALAGSAFASSGDASVDVSVAQAVIEQSVPQAAVVTIAVLSALIVVLLIAFIVWMRRRAHAEAEADADPSGGGALD